MSLETLKKIESESQQNIPENLEFGVKYDKPDNFLEDKNYETINLGNAKEIAQDIAKKYFIDNFNKNENGYLNAIVPTKSFVPFIVKRVIDEVLLNHLNIDKEKATDVLTVFSEIYDNFKGKSVKAAFDTFELKILIKNKQDNNTIQILAGNPDLEEDVEVDTKFEFDETSEEDMIKNLSENGRGLKIGNILSDKFEVRTNKDKTEYSYLAEIKL